MELRSFLAGILVLFGLENVLPFVGIRISMITPSPIVSLAFGLGAFILAYIFLKHG